MSKIKNFVPDEYEELEFEFESSDIAKTTRTLRNIKKALIYNLKKNYNIDDNNKLNQITDDILRIHGLHKENFDFINQASIVINNKLNDISIDDNSNKNEKTMKGLCKEVEAPIDKALGYDFLYRVIKELYGKKEAKRLTGRMYDYTLCLADSVNILLPYSYYGQTSILLRIDGKKVTWTLKQLYETYQSFGEYISDLDMYKIKVEDIKQIFDYKMNYIVGENEKFNKAKEKFLNPYKDDVTKKIKIEIWDSEKGWVSLKQIIKHKHDDDKKFVVYQTNNGDFAFVTEDHPVILQDNSVKLAIDLKENDEILKNDKLPKFKKTIYIPEDLAYLTGFMLGDGNRVEWNDKNYDYKNYDFFNCEYKKNSFSKRLPDDIFEWEDKSLFALICGLIISDGNINNGNINNGLIQIRLFSYAIINQLYDVMKQRNFKVQKDIHFIKNNFIFSISFYMDKKLLNYSDKIKNMDKEYFNFNSNMDSTIRDNKIKKIYIFKKNDIKDNSFLYQEIQDEYDVTTETGYFYSNGMVQHNCWSLDASKLVTIGKDFGQLKSKPVKRVDSYISVLNEVVHQISNHLAGAIAIGSFFLDVAHILIYKEKCQLEDLKISSIKKNLENQFQRLVHGVNSLSRTSNECVTKDTEVLTPDGFKTYKTLEKGDDIYTRNKEGCLNIQKVQKVNLYHYEGILHQYRGRDICQTVTPNHLVLKKILNSDTDKYELKESSTIFDLNASINIPIAMQKIEKLDYNISDDMLKLLAIILTNGYLDHSGIIIRLEEKYNIKKILKNLQISYKREKKLSEKNNFYLYNISAKDSEVIRALNNNNNKKDIPKFLFNLSQKQTKLFIETFTVFNGVQGKNNYDEIKLQCNSQKMADDIQHLCFLAGYGSRIIIDELFTYVIFYQEKNKLVDKKEKIYYDDIVWCPTTDDGVVVYRKEGQIFISGNSPFTNISLFDRAKIKSLISIENYGWYFPYTQDQEIQKEKWEDYVIEFIIKLQEIYIEFCDKGDPLRSGMPYRFPINTINISKSKDENGNIIIEDKKFLKSICKKDIYRYNIFVSEGTKVASCCFDENQKILVKNSKQGVYHCTFKEFENLSYKDYKENLKIAHNGNWVKGKLVKIPIENKKMYEIETVNNKKIVITDDHIHPTLNGDKNTIELTDDDYLVFNYNEFNSIPEQDKKLTYEEGIFIGNHLEDGKKLNLNCLQQSIEFRKGILDGIYFSDNKKNNKLYFTSKKLIEQIEILIMSLGMVSIIDEEFDKNHVTYCIRYYTPTLNHNRYQSNIYKIKNNSIGFKIKNIKEIKNYDKENVYCFEMENQDEPYFTLPNGVITHNCRLLSNSDLLDLAGQSNSFGGGSSISLGCYDDITEVLTDDGWKLFKDLEKDVDKILTLNKETKNLEYCIPTDYMDDDYDGTMHNYKHESLDFLVTPNHNMLVTQKDKDNFKLVPSQDLCTTYQLPRAVKGNLNIENLDTIIINNIEFDYKYFLKFLGFFIGDRTCCYDEIKAKKRVYEISFVLKKERKIKYIIEILNKLNIKYKKYPQRTREGHYRIVFYNKSIWEYINILFIKNKIKYIPFNFINSLNKINLECLLDGLINSDGHVTKEEKSFCYYTKYKHITDSLMLIGILLGYNVNYKKREREILFKKENRKIHSIGYEIYFNSVSKIHELKKYKKDVEYKGKIYCVTVPNNIMMIRRKGKTMWCGNSHRVVTLNFMRLGLQSSSYENFYELLDLAVSDSAKILKAHKQLLTFMTEKGLQCFISNGWIQLSRLFSTFGILGIVEAVEYLKKEYKINKDIDILKDILVYFNDKVTEYSKEYGIVGNIEQIPAESMAVRLPKVDKMLFNEKVKYDIYANQFIPLWDNSSSIWERMEEDGKYNQLLTGGGIVHLNMGEHITGKQAEKVIEYSIESGCEHFSLTATFCRCGNEHVTIGNVDKCPICSKEIEEKIARTVGYFTPVEDWSPTKREKDHDKRIEYSNGDFN